MDLYCKGFPVLLETIQYNTLHLGQSLTPDRDWSERCTHGKMRSVSSVNNGTCAWNFHFGAFVVMVDGFFLFDDGMQHYLTPAWERERGHTAVAKPVGHRCDTSQYPRQAHARCSSSRNALFLFSLSHGPIFSRNFDTCLTSVLAQERHCYYTRQQ